MKARTLLKKLIDYGLHVQAINDETIRLSPSELVNDEVIAFVQMHKNELLGALYGEHCERKAALGHRVQVLRIAIKQRFWRQRNSMCEKEFWVRVEAELDAILPKLGYDLESAIALQRSLYLDENFDMYGACKQCGYMPVFCGCHRRLRTQDE